MSFSKKFHWLEIFEYWPSNSSYFCKKHPQFTSIPIHLCLFHSSWRQGLQKFVFSLALQWIIFSKKVTTMTPLIGGWLWGVITVTFFDKMSCRRARVKIKIGMVTFSHPCVIVYVLYSRFRYFDFRQILLKQFRIGAILPKNLCRIQIWACKIGLPTGKMTSIKIQFFKNLHRCRCNQ